MSEQNKTTTPEFDEGSLGSFADFYDELERDLLLDPELTIQRDFMRYGERVRGIRRGKGLSQAKLAELSGLRQAQISDIENGVMKDGPTQRSMLKLSYALDTPDLAGLEAPQDLVMVETFEQAAVDQLLDIVGEMNLPPEPYVSKWRTKGKRHKTKYRAPKKKTVQVQPGDSIIISGSEEDGFSTVQLGDVQVKTFYGGEGLSAQLYGTPLQHPIGVSSSPRKRGVRKQPKKSQS